MKKIMLLLGMTLHLCLVPPIQAAETHATSNGSGTIMQFSIEDRDILINQKEYGLADRLQIVTKENIAASEMALKKGQSIEFWLDDSKKHPMHTQKGKEDLPMIKRIRVLSDVKMNY